MTVSLAPPAGFATIFAGYLGVDYWFRPWFRKLINANAVTAKSAA